ncbi:conserved hypothetical protein [Vibrio owensii]|nr:conserved hypothetical protein [Vibrio owensii]CAH1574030.1 conserved hypothetical protein [Vibrio owensii]
MPDTNQLWRMEDSRGSAGPSSSRESELQLPPLQQESSEVITLACVILRAGFAGAQQESFAPSATAELILPDWQP